MFDANLFVKTNLIGGMKKGAFAPEQVMIYAFNYLQRGTITQETFDEIQQAVDDYKAEQARLADELAKAEAEAEVE